jgi:hypothetical protein
VEGEVGWRERLGGGRSWAEGEVGWRERLGGGRLGGGRGMEGEVGWRERLGGGRDWFDGEREERLKPIQKIATNRRKLCIILLIQKPICFNRSHNTLWTTSTQTMHCSIVPVQFGGPTEY